MFFYPQNMNIKLNVLKCIVFYFSNICYQIIVELNTDA